MKTHTKGLIAAVGGILLIGSLTACGYYYRSPEARADHIVEEITEELELSSAQVAHLEALKTDLLTLRQTMEQRHEKAHDTLTAMLNQPTLDQQKALTLITDNTQFMNDQAPALIRGMAAFYDSLTQEQQAELLKMMQKHKKHRHWHH